NSTIATSLGDRKVGSIKVVDAYVWDRNSQTKAIGSPTCSRLIPTDNTELLQKRLVEPVLCHDLKSIKVGIEELDITLQGPVCRDRGVEDSLKLSRKTRPLINVLLFYVDYSVHHGGTYEVLREADCYDTVSLIEWGEAPSLGASCRLL